MKLIKGLLLVTTLLSSFNIFAMNKAELIDAIAKDAGLSKADSKRALEAYISTTAYTVKQKEKISILGFGTISSDGTSPTFNPDKKLTVSSYHQYFKSFWSTVLQFNAEEVSRSLNPLYKEKGDKGEMPTFEDGGYFSSMSYYAESFSEIFTKLSPTDMVSSDREEKVKIAQELNEYLQGAVSNHLIGHELAHVVQQSSSKIMQSSTGALLTQSLEQEKFYIDEKSENLGLTQEQFIMMQILFYAQDSILDGHVTVLKASSKKDGHVTVLKAVDHRGHVTVLKAHSEDGQVTELKAVDHRGHVTVLKAVDHRGHVTVLKAMESFSNTASNVIGKNDVIRLAELGSFAIPRNAAVTGRNPQTGKEIKIAAKNVVRFKAGSELSGKVN